MMERFKEGYLWGLGLALGYYTIKLCGWTATFLFASFMSMGG